jgi:hypothetical protein
MNNFILRVLISFVALLGSAAAISQTVPTVTLTASPTTGSGSVTPTLTWSSTNASACTASGGWTGSKATSGSQAATAVTANTTYTLTCTGYGAATLSWTAPTARTDGNPLTNLASYEVHTGTTATNLVFVKSIPAPATSNVVGNLLAGTWYFGMKSVDATGLKSVMSNIASKVVSVPSGSAAVTVTVTVAPPNPPVLSTIVVKVWEVQQKWYGTAVVRVGSVPLGEACNDVVIRTYYHEILDRSAISFTGKYRGTRPLGKCA